MASSSDALELHVQIADSISLLDSLQSFLSSFQRDLSAVSGQIADLQSRSKDIDRRLQNRKKIEKSLAGFIDETCLPPPIVITILDTNVDDAWIPAVAKLESTLDALHSRSRLKSVKELTNVAEGLRIAAVAKLRAYFLAILNPLKTSMSTNLQVIQSGMLLKYQSLYAFLRRHAPSAADEVQGAYIASVRVFYETGFRRYIRTLGSLKSKAVEKNELITAGDRNLEAEYDDVLKQSDMNGAGAILAYLADSRTFVESIVSLFRSAMLVLMDNASCEYLFLSRFFQTAKVDPQAVSNGAQDDPVTTNGTESTAQAETATQSDSSKTTRKEPAVHDVDTIWKGILEPSLGHAHGFVKSLVEGSLSVTTLLAMIRINESILRECEVRACKPMETFCLGVRMIIWPVFQRGMDTQVTALKKFADSASGGILSKGYVKDSAVQTISQRYASMFQCMVALSDEEEGMLFSNLSRLRAELHRLIINQSEKIRDPKESAAYRARVYDSILQALAAGRPNIHPKAQAESAFWRTKEEEARRRIQSAR